MPYAFHHRKNRWPVSDGITKQCRKCRETKPLTVFHVNRKNADGKQHFCKECGKANSYGYRTSDGGKVRFIAIRQKSRLLKFKITPDDYDAMLIAQDGRCAICKEPEIATIRGRPKRLAIDHCHTTGKIRGLLCAHCNHAIGKLHDNPELLRRAANYIEQAR